MTGSRHWARPGAGKFSAEYPALISPDTELECFNLQARNARWLGGATLAKRLWFSNKDVPESCSKLFDYLQQNQLLNRTTSGNAPGSNWRPTT